MSQIPDNQGAIKASEISVDAALAAIGSTVGTDALSVISQIQQLASDSFFKQGLMPFSTGRMNWDGTQILFNSDTRANDLIIRVLQTDSTTLRTIDLKITGDLTTNTTTTFNSVALANGDLIYLEIDRAVLNAAPAGILTIENAVGGGSIVPGKTLRKVNLTSTTGMAQITSLIAGGGTSLFIPLCFRYDWTDGTNSFQDLMWAINGNRWAKNTVNYVGTAGGASGSGNSSYTATVGSATDVSNGIAQYTSIQTALTALVSNAAILVLKSYTTVENVTVSGNKFTIEGQNAGTVITGNVIIDTNVQFTKMDKISVTGNVTLNAGTTNNDISNIWVSSTSTVTDNGTSDNNFIVAIQA